MKIILTAIRLHTLRILIEFAFDSPSKTKLRGFSGDVKKMLFMGCGIITLLGI